MNNNIKHEYDTKSKQDGNVRKAIKYSITKRKSRNPKSDMIFVNALREYLGMDPLWGNIE